MAQTETGQQKQRKLMPQQPIGMPMGLHDGKRAGCLCGRCSFTKHKDVFVKTSVGK